MTTDAFEMALVHRVFGVNSATLRILLAASPPATRRVLG